MANDENADIIWLPVAFSQAEYLKMRKERALTPDGVTWQVVRERLGLQPRPIRYAKGRHSAVLEEPHR